MQGGSKTGCTSYGTGRYIRAVRETEPRGGATPGPLLVREPTVLCSEAELPHQHRLVRRRVQLLQHVREHPLGNGRVLRRAVQAEIGTRMQIII